MFGNYQWVEAVDASDDQQERQGQQSSACIFVCGLCQQFTFPLPDLTFESPIL